MEFVLTTILFLGVSPGVHPAAAALRNSTTGAPGAGVSPLASRRVSGASGVLDLCERAGAPSVPGLWPGADSGLELHDPRSSPRPSGVSNVLEIRERAAKGVAFAQDTALQVGRGARNEARSPAKAEEEFGDAAEFEDEFGVATDEGPTKKVFDPLIGYNRAMFYFNDKVWFWVWRPMAKGYSKVVPEPARVALGRAFYNFWTPVRFGNSLLQLKFKRAGIELGRLLVNSTIGLAGFFDPADKWLGWRRPPKEDFGQTLGRYGVGAGFPLVLPLLGPCNLRDGLGWVPDILMSPIIYFVPTETSVGITAGKYFNRSSLRIGEYESLKKDALDPYTFFRDVYRQNRDKKIKE